MAKITMTTTVNTQTGAPINTFAIGVNDIIKSVVLRPKMCGGAYMYTQEALALTVADGSQATATIPGSDPTPIAGRGATMTVESSTITATTYTEGLSLIHI